MLQSSQQAKVPQLSRNEDDSFEAPGIDSNLDILAAALNLSQPQSPALDALARPYAATFDLIPNNCEQDCSCTCHQGGRVRSPPYLSTILGSLLIGYTAQPWMTCLWESYDCRGRSSCITYTYAFPRWLLDRMVACRIAYDRLRGPELCVRLLRVRSGHEYIFWVAIMRTSDTDKTSIRHMKYLLTNGLFSRYLGEIALGLAKTTLAHSLDSSFDHWWYGREEVEIVFRVKGRQDECIENGTSCQWYNLSYRTSRS